MLHRKHEEHEVSLTFYYVVECLVEIKHSMDVASSQVPR